MIRAATPADAAQLSAIHHASFADGWSEADMAVWLARPEAFAVMATRDRLAIAFGLALTAGDDAELLSIATLPEARRAGLGRKILAALDAQAAERGLKRFVFEAARNNLPALGLYLSSGFVEIAVRKAYYPGPEGRVDALVLAAPVGRASK